MRQFLVIPAKAGIQLCNVRLTARRHRIPACAGMTVIGRDIDLVSATPGDVP